MKLQTQGLIIKETPVGENDKLLVILTRTNGVVRAFADGARKMKGRNAASTALFCYADFTLYKGKDTYKVSDSVPIELFFDLRFNLEGFSLAQYFCEMTLRLAPEENEPADYLRLLLNSLYFLTAAQKPQLLIKCVTELRMISIAGYMPDLTVCAGCGDENASPVYFNLADGCMFCTDCATPDHNTVVLNPTLLATMRHILYSDFSKIYSFQIPPEQLNNLSAISERYVATQADFRFQTLDFYKSIRINEHEQS